MSLLIPPQQAASCSSGEEKIDPAGGNDRIPETARRAFWRAVWREPISLFTFMLAIATIFLGVVAALQTLILLGTDQTAQRAAEAAKKSSDALMAGQRAIVVPTPYWEPDGNPAAGAWVFGVKWENVGNLGTRRMRNYINFQYIGGDLPTDFQFPDDVPPLASGTMLGSKKSILGPHVPKEGNISAQQIGAIQRGERKLFIHGWVKYFDGFPDTPERITKFCFGVRVTGNPDMPFVFPPCYRHNCSDEECEEE
jgi:hypothetical protein